MPSISNPSKVDKSVIPDIHQEPLSKVQLLVDNKIRNLEKRKSRLEQYRAEAKAGKELNHDQKKAIKRYDEVVEMLEFFKEFKKNVQTIYADHAKQLKKLARKERPGRDPKEIERLKLVFLFQDLLENLGGEASRKDFLQGANGAIQITEEKLKQLDELSKLVYPDRTKAEEPFDKQLTKAAERYLALVEGIRGDALKGTSFRELKETLISINDCGYFDVTVKSVSTSGASATAVKPSVSSSTSQQLNQTAENINLKRVTENQIKATQPEASRPSASFESITVKPSPVSHESHVPLKQDITGTSEGNKYQQQPPQTVHQPHQAQQQPPQPQQPHQQHQHQNKIRSGNTNQSGMNEMISNVGHSSAGHNPAAPSSYNFLQESRLEMEGAPHMDPAVVAMAPVPGSYSTAYGGNQSMEALAAQLASTGIPPMSSATNMTKGVTTYENTGSAHQPIPTQTFTNQRFTAMMAGGTFVQSVPIAANPSMLGLPVQLTSQSMASHPSGSNDQMSSNQPSSNETNQGHGMNIGNLGQSMVAYPSEANFTQYQPPHHEGNNSRSNQGPSRDKHNYQGDDNINQGGYGSSYGRYRGSRGGRGGGSGDRGSGAPRPNKYNSLNGYNSRGRGGGPGPRNSGKPPQDKPPRTTSDNRNISNQWS